MSRWIRCVAIPRVRPFLEVRADAPWNLRGSPSAPAALRSERLPRIEPLRLRISSSTGHHVSEEVVAESSQLWRRRKRRGRHPSRTATPYIPPNHRLLTNNHRQVTPPETLEQAPTVTLSSEEDEGNDAISMECELPTVCRRTSRGRISRPPVRSDGSIVLHSPSRPKRKTRPTPVSPEHPLPPSTTRPRRSLASARHYFEDIEDEADDDDDDDALVENEAMDIDN